MPGPIVVLIGADVAVEIWYGNRAILSTGVVAVDTLFGWILISSAKKPPITCCSTNLPTTFTMTPVTTGDVTDLWRLEAIDITGPAEENSDMKRLST
ncbi:hypothetical protein PR048_025562 [Dryococelus australis]|uniref:Uncharacterized protein n=1 Tax=Dryococelus australis TaxID=614101 RepID=A0ABQ9GRM8_9NEOP|nr:hypothetical protein PR048_025562 [Dryococelus australis]